MQKKHNIKEQDSNTDSSKMEEYITALEKENLVLKSEIKTLESHIAMLKEQELYFRESYYTISNAFFWKISQPIRDIIDRIRSRHNLISSDLQINDIFSETDLIDQKEIRFPRDIKFSILVPVFNTKKRYLCEMIESVQNQTYANWELCIADGSDARHSEVGVICQNYSQKDSRIHYRKLNKNYGICENTNQCLKIANGDYIALLDHDDLLHPSALFEVMNAICTKDADFIYTDETVFYNSPDDAFDAHLKPAFGPDSLCGNNYICHFTVFKRALLKDEMFDPECEGSQDHDLVLRLTETATVVAHIPEILYYWRANHGSVAEDINAKPYVFTSGKRAVEKHLIRKGIEGTVEQVSDNHPAFHIRYSINGNPKVSILIPNKDHLSDLKKCINSIFLKTTWNHFEIVIVENNSKDKKLFEYYKHLENTKTNIRIVTYQGEFNYSAINNFGAKYCAGDYLLLLNNDTQVITPDWIQEMLMFAQREDVGAVGAMLYYPDNTIQHAGVAIGLGNTAGHLYKDHAQGEPGNMLRLLYAQNVSAVTGACLMTRKEVWDSLKGLDESFAVAFNDIDYCLRIRESGRLIVWTPFAELYHYESRSRGYEDTPKKQKRLFKETDQFQKRWESVLIQGDPYYNPNFSLNRNDHHISLPLLPHSARVVCKHNTE